MPTLIGCLDGGCDMALNWWQWGLTITAWVLIAVVVVALVVKLVDR